MADSEISVVLPVHAAICPSHLTRALESLIAQTHPAAEIVLVEDGPLSDSLHGVIARFAHLGPELVKVVLPENEGAGVANGAGLRAARGTWIAKADADDMSEPNRFERQLTALARFDLDLVGSAMLEFEDEEDNVVAVRSVPETPNAIARRMRMNSPMNHPTVMYRRSVALAVGGYSSMRFMQDYDLFARMYAAGARMRNLSEPLVRFRADELMYARRTSAAMTGCEWDLQHNLVRYGVISWPRMWVNLALRLSFRRLPRRALRLAYRLLFHTRSGVLERSPR